MKGGLGVGGPRLAGNAGIKAACGYRRAEESIAIHYAKHGAGAMEAEYDAAARAWAAGPTGTGTPVQLADGSWGVRYRAPRRRTRWDRGL